MNQSLPDPDRAAQARALCDQGAWPEVLALTEGWRAGLPDDPKAWFYHGAALAALGRFMEADTAYRRSLALDPKDAKTWNNLAKLSFEALERPAEAMRCLQQLLSLDPKNKLAWVNLGSLLGKLGRHEDALKCADKALALDAHMSLALVLRARAAQGLGRTEILKETSAILAQLPPEKFSRVP
jgi:tetratricopeptide (TPR) repeat protein